MWMLYSMFAVTHIALFPSIILHLHATGYQLSKRFSQKSTNDNVLRNTEPPTIIKELPLSVVFYSNTILRLRCNIRGNPRPIYKWYVSTVDLTDSTKTPHDQTYDFIRHATDDILIIDGNMTDKSYFKYVYFCSAQNALGILETNKVIVQKVTRPPSLSVKYIRYLVYEGEKFVVQCTLEPDIVPLYKFKYWEVHLKSGDILKINETVGRFSVFTATKLPQLHVRNVTEDDFRSTRFRCIFQSSIDNRDDIPFNYLQPIEAFTYIDLSLSTKLACTGETLTAALGTNIELPFCSVPRTLAVTWYKINPYHSKKRILIGDKENVIKFSMISRRYGNLLIKNVTKDDAGKYLVESTNRRLQTTFTLNIYETPLIHLTPGNIRKKWSESAEFFCTTNVQKCKFRWLHNGQRIATGYDEDNVEIITTFSRSSMRVKNARLSVSGVYQCIIIFMDEIKGGSDYRQISGTLLLSEVYPMLVKQSPRVEKDSSTAHIQMSRKNNTTSIECVFAANPTPNVDWYHNSNKVPIVSAITVTIERDQFSIYNFISIITINLDKLDPDEDIRKYAGEYQAIATNSLGFTTCNTFIFMDGKLEIQLPMEQTAVGGRDYIMTCFFVAMDVPEFSWDRKVINSDTWETLPVNHRTDLLEKGHRLILKNVIQSEDEGDYRCTIRYNKEIKVALTRLLVSYPPILQNLPTKHDSSQSQTHICTIKSTADKPWYAWWTFTKYTNNETIVISPSSNDPLFTVYYNRATTLQIRHLDDVPEFLYRYPNVGVDINVKARSDDKETFGKFTCHARNLIGYDAKTIEDNYLRLEFKKIPPSSTEVVVGDDLYIDCTAKESDLKPVVKWRLLKGDSKYVDVNEIKKEHNNRIFQFDNGTLVMKNIKETDPSKLICFIFPLGKSDQVQSKISYIEIKVPARIKPFVREIYKVAGSSFNLSCQVFGHNQNLLVTWYSRTSDMAPWKNIYDACIYSNENPCMNRYQSNQMDFIPINEIHNRTYHSVHLLFRDAIDSVSGSYKCEARNKYNKEIDKKSTKLTIISKPSIVIFDQINKESTATSVSVDWKPPERDGNRNVFQYIITYSEMLKRQNNENYKNVTQTTVRVNSTVHSLVIDHLRPNKKYRIDISAENEVGVSEAATVYLPTQESQPESPVKNLIASSTNPHEILISWLDPDPDFQNGVINKYQMCYQIIATIDELKTSTTLEGLSWPENMANLNEFPKVKCQYTEARTITVSFLPQFTVFAVRVIAFNSKGASPSSFTKVRTLEDLPQAPPSNVTYESLNQAISLKWNPPGRQTINGVLKGYVVYYYEPNKYNDESGMKSISVQGRTSVIIDQLKPFTLYSIHIMAENRKGFGPPSETVFCRTKEAKPEPPEMVKALKINDTCLFVSWLHTPSPNGRLREYCAVDFGGNVRKCQRPEMQKRYNTMIFCDRYLQFTGIKVFARNKYDGHGRESSILDDTYCITSIGGTVNVAEGSTIILPCELVSTMDKIVYWKKNGELFGNNDLRNVRILKNFSLEISSISKLDRNYYSCHTEADSIEYQLIVQESTDSVPRAPIIDDTRVTENSVFIRWKSHGTNNLATPIKRFIVNWENLFTGESNTILLSDSTRSFYLSNVTCASDFLVKVSSESSNSRSQFSETQRLRTLGSVPLFGDTSVLLPQKSIGSHSANFNLLAFEPGQNCSAMYFTIEIKHSSSGHQSVNNVTVYDLKNKCCFKITGLNPMTTYSYVVTAYNPAGPTTSYNFFQTTGIRQVAIPSIDGTTFTFGNHFWLLITVFVIVLILILIVVAVGVLQIAKSRAKQTQNAPSKSKNQKIDFKQNRNYKIGYQDDTASMGSEPSPYAVYQPDMDKKPGQRSQQVSQLNSTPLYNYSEHPYNKIRYDKILGRPIALECRRDKHRRANSAECLSSLGKASVAGIADLESPDNIDPNDYCRAPYLPIENDEIFRNIQYPDFSTVSRKRMRTESEGMCHANEGESSRLINNNNNQEIMNTSRHYEHRAPMTQLIQQPAQSREQLPMYSTSVANNNVCNIYRQQMSVPEPVSKYNEQFGYRSNRLRSISGSGRNPHASQTVLKNSSRSSGQPSGYGSYYGSRGGNNQLFSSSANVRRDSEHQNHQYSSYIAGSGISNYNPVHRTSQPKPALERIESPDEGIYTDQVIVV